MQNQNIKERFNHNADNIQDAMQYMSARSKQLLRLGYLQVSLSESICGRYVQAFYCHESTSDEVLQSIYILTQYRGQGLFKKARTHKILTAKECNISNYMWQNGIPYKCENLEPFHEYALISKFYAGGTAARSGVELMNHIDEGLYILSKIGASDTAMKAYCIHPMVQGDDALLQNVEVLQQLSPAVVAAAMEYRSVANEYLSRCKIQSIDEIRLSPLKDVNDMLIADKIQNFKDFMRYHFDKHERSSELLEYFNNWLTRLGVDSHDYKMLTMHL